MRGLPVLSVLSPSCLFSSLRKTRAGGWVGVSVGGGGWVEWVGGLVGGWMDASLIHPLLISLAFPLRATLPRRARWVSVNPLMVGAHSFLTSCSPSAGSDDLTGWRELVPQVYRTVGATNPRRPGRVSATPFADWAASASLLLSSLILTVSGAPASASPIPRETRRAVTAPSAGFFLG